MRSSLFLVLVLGHLALPARASQPVLIPLPPEAVTAERLLPGALPMVGIDNAYRLTIFLNFDGETLVQGGSDARANTTDLITQSPLPYPAQTWSGLGGKEQGMKAVVDELKIIFMNYAVEFTTTRPTSGDFTMAMVGGTGEGCKRGGPGTVGIAPLDCKNSNKNDIVLIFGDQMSGSPRSLANVIAHELGHSFGLEHVEDKQSIMYPQLLPETCCWVSSAVTPPGTCGRSTQDDAEVLKENLGVGEGDTVQPRAWFRFPGAGAILPPSFSLEVLAADDLRIHHVALFLDGEKRTELFNPPYATTLANLSDGEHRLRAVVFDWKPNETAVEILVTVDSGCIERGTCFGGGVGLGEACVQSTDCASGKCAKQALQDESGRCAELCDAAAKVCAGGTACEQSGEEWLCLPGPGWTVAPSAEGGGGCSLAGADHRPLALGLLLLLLLPARRWWR